jgi:hypothetical protein
MTKIIFYCNKGSQGIYFAILHSLYSCMRLYDILYCTVANKCPRCKAARVFESNNPYSLKNGVKMYKHCASCGLKYEREVGYFYGAMYVSYGIQTLLVSICYFLNEYWWNLSSLTLVLIIIGSAAVLFPVTFRWSRIMWIAMFTAYDGSYKGKAFRDEVK